MAVEFDGDNALHANVPSAPPLYDKVFADNLRDQETSRRYQEAWNKARKGWIRGCALVGVLGIGSCGAIAVATKLVGIW